MGIDTEDFGFVLCDIDVCFCDVEMEFKAYQQTAERERVGSCRDVRSIRGRRSFPGLITFGLNNFHMILTLEG